MKNLITRTLTGILFTGSIIGSILWDPYVFSGLILVFTGLIAWEYYSMFGNANVHPHKPTGIAFTLLAYVIFTLAAFFPEYLPLLIFLIPLILFFFVIELFRKQDQAAQNIATGMLPLFYVALPMASLNYIYTQGAPPELANPGIILGFFILIWTGDTMAYLGGMLLGKHKLFERISPKKTWEGSISGLIFSLVVAWVLSIFFKEMNYLEWMGMALVVSVAGTLGDLAESMLKRNAGVKDSGNLLPGHGGFLDRFDSLLFSAPMVFIYILIISRGL